MAAKKPRVEVLNLEDLEPDDANVNIGTERGRQMLEESLRRYGAGRSILIDKQNRIIGGNKTHEEAGALGFKRVIVVDSDGTDLVAVRRVEKDLHEDPEARGMALADNRVAEANLAWDAELLKMQFEDDALDMEDFWRPDEIMFLDDEVPADYNTSKLDGAEAGKPVQSFLIYVGFDKESDYRYAVERLGTKYHAGSLRATARGEELIAILKNGDAEAAE